MKKIIITFTMVLSFAIGNKTYSQCTINASPDSISICEGDMVVLSAYSSCEDTIFSDDFNTGQLGRIWTTLHTTAIFTNPCSPSLDSTTYLWVGPASTIPRELVTKPFNIPGSGCKISFEMKYGTQSDPSPCEGPDLTTEGVHLQYSPNDSIGPWTDINYWNPNGGFDSSRINWNLYIENIPASAATPNTYFRWYQVCASSNSFDHWGLDNVQVICPLSQGVSWAHGPTELTPAPVYPNHDTMFTITVYDYTTGISTYDTVFVSVDASPSIFTITGGGSYPRFGSGVSIGLDGSELGVDYSLIRNGFSTIGTLPGTGSSLDFGLQVSSGTFTVTAKDQITNCTQLMNDSAVITIITSIEESQIVDFNIYPNPTNGIFTLEGENIELVSITDISGKVIFEKEVKEDIIEVDLSTYPKAMYFVNVYTESGVGVEKIIME